MTSCVLLLVIPSGSGNPLCRLIIMNDSNPPVKFLGVTPPITTDPPKPNDIKSSEALMADLVALNQFESDQERKVRYVHRAGKAKIKAYLDAENDCFQISPNWLLNSSTMCL